MASKQWRCARKWSGGILGFIATGLLGAGAASAQLPGLNPVLVVCPAGGGTSRFSPGLTNTPKPTHLSTSTTFSLCQSLDASVVAAFTSSQIGPVPLSCGLVNVGQAQELTLTWNTGETSSLSLTAIRVEGQGEAVVLVRTGTVVQGKFKGARAILQKTYVTSDLELNCLTPQGLEQLDDVATLILTTL